MFGLKLVFTVIRLLMHTLLYNALPHLTFSFFSHLTSLLNWFLNFLFQFLDRCTSLLDLPFPARRLFDEDGHEHFNLRSLRRDQLVTVTCGEPWCDPKLSKAEQQRRYLLSNLAADVTQIQEYVSLRNPESKLIYSFLCKICFKFFYFWLCLSYL